MNKSKNKHTYEADLMTLVKMIEERPCIWDKSYVKEPGERKKAWKEICRHFAPIDFDDMEKEEQTKLEDNLHGKWKNLRDTFIKSTRMNSMHLYKHHEKLKFLMKNLNLNQPASRPVEKSGNSHTPPRRHSKRISSPFSTCLARKRKRPSAVPKTVKVNSPILTQKDIKQEPPFQESATNDINPISDLHQKNVVPDEDEAFFISIMPSVKKFSDDEKLEFRMGVLSTILEINQRSKMKNISVTSNSECSSIFFVTNDDFTEVKDEISDSDNKK